MGLDGGKAILQVGNRLVFRHVVHPAWDSNHLEQAALEVVDLTNPAQPVHSSTVDLPDGFGHSLLVKNGLSVLTSHWEPLANDASKVKFYLDRVAFPPIGLPVAAPSIGQRARRPALVRRGDLARAHDRLPALHRPRRQLRRLLADLRLQLLD